MEPKILVTGANGFTGRWFCQYLASQGFTLRALYYPPDGKPVSLDESRIELIPGDVRNRDEIARAVKGVETVYHIAALYRPANVRKKDYFEVNVQGTRILVEESAKAQVKKLVHCSTIGVHGTVGKTPATELSPIQPDDYYQESKWLGEKLALELSKKLNLPITVIRPAAIYGPEEKRFLKLTQLINRGRFIMFGKGETLYHFINVKDLSDAFILAANSDKSNGESYIIADDHAITINKITEIVAEGLGVKPPKLKIPFSILYLAAIFFEYICKPFGLAPPIHRRRASWFKSDRIFDISKAKQDLGYQPKVKIEDGLIQMVESYRAAGWLS